MVRRSDHEKVRHMLKDTIMLLCKNGLSFKNKFTIEAVIGVTVDEDDVFLLSMNEIVNSVRQESSSEACSSDDEVETSRAPAKRKRTPDRDDTGGSEEDANQPKVIPNKLFIVDSSNSEAPFSVVNQDEDGDDEDIVFVKEEEKRSRDSRPEMNYPDFTAMASAYQTQEITMTPPRCQPAPMWQNMGNMPRNSLPFPMPPRPSLAGLGPSMSLAGLTTTMSTNPIMIAPKLDDFHMTPKSIRQSTPKSPLQCSMCNKSFTERSYLRKHQDAHRGVYPFHCHICLKGVLTKQHLRYHMDKLHKEGGGWEEHIPGIYDNPSMSSGRIPIMTTESDADKEAATVDGQDIEDDPRALSSMQESNPEAQASPQLAESLVDENGVVHIQPSVEGETQTGDMTGGEHNDTIPSVAERKSADCSENSKNCENEIDVMTDKDGRNHEDN